MSYGKTCENSVGSITSEMDDFIQSRVDSFFPPDEEMMHSKADTALKVRCFGGIIKSLLSSKQNFYNALEFVEKT